MDSNRRGFLGILAHVPLLGMLLSKPSYHGGQHQSPYGLAKPPPPPAPPRIKPSQETIMAWTAHEVSSGPILVEFCSARDRYEVTAACCGHSMDRKIRWIPVSERMPDKPGIKIVGLSTGQVTVSGHTLGRNAYWTNLNDFVTHWAELPAPPTEEKPGHA